MAKIGNHLYPSVSGQITDSATGLPVSGISIALQEPDKYLGYEDTTTTDANGNYAFYTTPDGNYKITPSAPGKVFTPLNRTFSITRTGIVSQDFSISVNTQKPPILLVHGWQGGMTHLKCEPNNIDPMYLRTEVIDFSEPPTDTQNGALGWINARDYWGDMPGWLEENYDVWIGQYTTGLIQGTSAIEVNAQCIKNQIDYVYTHSGNQPITLIAHSTGGLVSRSCLNFPDCRNKVNKLITLGTPHKGLSGASLYLYANLLAALKGRVGQSSFFTKQMAVNQMSFELINQFNNRTPMQRAVKYLFIGGTANPPPSLDLSLLTTIDPRVGPYHDGLVGAYSAIDWEHTLGHWQPAWLDGFLFIDAIWTDEVHSKTFSSPKYPNNIYYYMTRLN